MPRTSTNSDHQVAYAEPLPPEPRVRDLFTCALRTLDDAGVPCIVGGEHANAHHTGLRRDAGRLQLFIKPDDQLRALNALAHAGFRTEYVHVSWSARAMKEDDAHVVDLIYNSRNGLCPVDDDWFRHAKLEAVLGLPARLCPAEELLWTCAFAQDAHRYAGADVAHLMLRRGKQLDWQRLLRRFHRHERVLLAHCVLFGYVYPTERECVPDWVLDHLHAAARHEPEPHVKLCRGPLLSRGAYAADVTDWGYVDARLQPHGPLTAEEIAQMSKE